jgi:hypothetical protein
LLCGFWGLSIKMILKEAMPILGFDCPQCQNQGAKKWVSKRKCQKQHSSTGGLV